MKQYSCDLALTLIALLLAAGPARDHRERSGGADRSPSGPRRLLALGVFGAIGVWFSYPLALVLAGVGTYLLRNRPDPPRRAGAPDWSRSAWPGWPASPCATWSRTAFSAKERFIWDWWDFAFLRLPPRSLAELTFDFWQIMNVFDSPADVKTPMGMIPTAMLAMATDAGGCGLAAAEVAGRAVSAGVPVRVRDGGLALHQYPFHGRLLIFLVPAVQMLVAQGAAIVARPGGPLLATAIGGFLLSQPVCDATWYQFIQPLSHSAYDSHGDLRPDLLDYLGAERSRS